MNTLPRRPACRPAAVPAHLRDWLFDTRSLTRRLARMCPGGPAVHRVSQGWDVPLPSERALLGLGLRERALVREVVLCCGDAPWVFGRSVFPRRTLSDARWRISQLGNRSLGGVLFSIPGMRRVEVRVTHASGGVPLQARCAALLDAAEPGDWQRSSIFALRGRTLLVSELFLDGFSRAAAAQ